MGSLHPMTTTSFLPSSTAIRISISKDGRSTSHSIDCVTLCRRPFLRGSTTGYVNPSIRESLNRLTSTTIAATNCFYDNAAKSWVSETFHLFDRYKLYQEQKRQGSPLPLSFIELSEVFARSVAIANYIKDLDLKTYYSLALPISKRLFRYLDKNRYNNALLTISKKMDIRSVHKESRLRAACL